MSALKGQLYRSSRQVQPLVVNRFVKSKQELTETFGAESRRGCAVVHYALPQENVGEARGKPVRVPDLVF